MRSIEMTKVYVVRLSHENYSLAYSELQSILISEDVPYTIGLKLDEFVLLEAPEIAVKLIMKRAGLALELGNLIDIIEVENEDAVNYLVKTVKDIDEGDNICIEVDSIKGFGKDTAKVLVERIGVKKLCTRKKIDVGVKTVKVSFIVNIALVYSMFYRRKQKAYIHREPHKRPCYRPGTMKPLLARVFINLSKVSSLKHEVVLDPFCGVGGFAVEACLMDLRMICCDIDDLMVRGAKANINGYSCQPMVDIVKMDAGFEALGSSRVDGIATDPPYGILSSPKGDKSLENLICRFLENSYAVLRKGRYLVFATPVVFSRKIDEMLRVTGFDIIEKHLDKVHGSLTRVIYVVKKI
ncbi:MAG: TRM11 family methyltransferase [Ignisphaera sp.]